MQRHLDLEEPLSKQEVQSGTPDRKGNHDSPVSCQRRPHIANKSVGFYVIVKNVYFKNRCNVIGRWTIYVCPMVVYPSGLPAVPYGLR